MVYKARSPQKGKKADGEHGRHKGQQVCFSETVWGAQRTKTRSVRCGRIRGLALIADTLQVPKELRSTEAAL